MRFSKFTQTKCPKCGNIIEGWHFRTISIGKETLQCIKCGHIFLSKESFGWKNTKNIEKILFIVFLSIQTFWYSLISTGLLAVLLELVFKIDFFLDNSGQPTRIGVITVIFIPVMITFIRTTIFIRDIKKTAV